MQLATKYIAIAGYAIIIYIHIVTYITLYLRALIHNTLVIIDITISLPRHYMHTTLAVIGHNLTVTYNYNYVHIYT
jgi:hypothetical protein